MPSDRPFAHEHLESFMALVAGWSTTELLTGLLAHPELLEELTRGTTADRLNRPARGAGWAAAAGGEAQRSRPRCQGWRDVTPA